MGIKRFVKEAYVALKLTGESIVFAFSSLKNDKFRTFLSLLGVSVGIFSIVAVFCSVDALQMNVKEGLSTLGGDILMVNEIPWDIEDEDGGEYKWWEYINRPPMLKEEYIYLKNNLTEASNIAYVASSTKLIQNGRNSFPEGIVMAVTPDLEKVMNMEIEEGRYFSPFEIKNAPTIAVIGASVAETLFPNGNAVGKECKVGGFSTTVVGTIKKQGESVVSFYDFDNSVIVPINYGGMMFDTNRGGIIFIKPKPNADQELLYGETRSKMRSIRRLRPEQEDNFALNRMSFINKIVGEVFAAISSVGWVVGGFSLLIGGFGIANIMFVSVKERTNQIGIQKALGAKRYLIVSQFLVEASVISLAGGMVGILLVFIATLFFRDNPSFPLTLTLGNAERGIVVALIIGILFGIIPANSAARLDPVKAINS